MAVLTTDEPQDIYQPGDWLKRERCFHCHKPMFAPAIEWRGQAEKEYVTLYLHPACAVEFAIRLLRDVHEIECRAPARLGLKMGRSD